MKGMVLGNRMNVHWETEGWGGVSSLSAELVVLGGGKEGKGTRGEMGHVRMGIWTRGRRG